MAKQKLSNNEAISLGARIRAVRKALGYKKSTDFQKALGFSPTVYYQWELGRRTPDKAAIKKICEHCKINQEWLATGKDTPFSKIKIEKPEATEKEAIIAYELLTNKLAETRQPVPKKLQKTIISYAESEKKDSGSPNMVYIAIKEELMAAILKELITTYEEARKNIDADQLAKFSSQIYADIIASETDTKLQNKLIKAMCNTYKRFI